MKTRIGECEQCGLAFLQQGVGRRRRFCNGTCQKRLWRVHQAGRSSLCSPVLLLCMGLYTTADHDDVFPDAPRPFQVYYNPTTKRVWIWLKSDSKWVTGSDPDVCVHPQFLAGEDPDGAFLIMCTDCYTAEPYPKTWRPPIEPVIIS